jgi:glycine C-acetyltransferase
MFSNVKSSLQAEIQGIRDAGLYKQERVITTPQGPVIGTTTMPEVLNFCANNYLGLSSHPEVIEAAIEAIRSHGYGLSSVRFICGTQDIHKELEHRIAEFLGMEDTILYAAAFDANGGLFEPLLGEEDAIISDELNHASIIDGIRLCKAKRLRYKHNDMNSLEECLKEASAGVAPETHFHRRCIFHGRHDRPTRQNLRPGRAIRGHGGHRRMPCLWLFGQNRARHPRIPRRDGPDRHHHRHARQSPGRRLGASPRPKKKSWKCCASVRGLTCFPTPWRPAIVGASIKVLELLSGSTALRDKLERNTQWFRKAMTAAGFDIIPGEHPITPIMLYEAPAGPAVCPQNCSTKASMSSDSFYPVVPKGKARIRVQLSAAHEQEHLERAVAAFTKVGRELGVIK